MRATEKAQRAAGIGATSGYWKHADAHRRALLEPMPKGTIYRDTTSQGREGPRQRPHPWPPESSTE